MHDFLIFTVCVGLFIVANFLGSEWQSHIAQKRMSLMLEGQSLTEVYEPKVRAHEVLSEQLRKQLRSLFKSFILLLHATPCLMAYFHLIELKTLRLRAVFSANSAVVDWKLIS
mgnify:CR=1 FL=1